MNKSIDCLKLMDANLVRFSISINYCGLWDAKKEVLKASFVVCFNSSIYFPYGHNYPGIWRDDHGQRPDSMMSGRRPMLSLGRWSLVAGPSGLPTEPMYGTYCTLYSRELRTPLEVKTVSGYSTW